MPHALGVLASLLCCQLPASTAEPGPVPKHPNVLFIVADDLRPDLGCYGHAEALTPNIDALAKRGTLFNRAYCQQAVCNPSRASVMTGLRPDTLRVWDLQTHFRETRPDAVTLPQYFRRHGYFAKSIGKIFHNDMRPESAPLRFYDAASWSDLPAYATGPHWRDWVVPGRPGGPEQKQGAMQCLDVDDDEYLDGKITASAVAALAELRAEEQPFFLAVGFWKPHLPFNAPKKYWDRYDRSKLSGPANPSAPVGAPGIAHHDGFELRNYGGISAAGPLTDELTMELRHGYLACVSFLDAQIGRLIAELDHLGLTENTIIVLWGDHGFHLGEHDLWAKTSNYELDARVPLIVVTPGRRPRGEKTDAMVELVDLYPTLVELAGLPRAAGTEGASFMPVLSDAGLPGKPFALTQHPHPFYQGKPTAMGYAVRTDRYRYVEWRDLGSGAVVARELYDHQADPRETLNLSDDLGYSADRERMAQTCRQGYNLPDLGEHHDIKK